MQVLYSEVGNQGTTRRYTLNLEHVSNAEKLMSCGRGAVLELLHARGDVLDRESFKVAETVVQGDRED